MAPDEVGEAELELVKRWSDARKERDYETADRIRAELREQGLEPDVIAARMVARSARSGRRLSLTGRATPTEGERAKPPAVAKIPSGPTQAQLLLARKWEQAKRERDYETADRIRATLRSAGFEAEELVLELEMGAISNVNEVVALAETGTSSANVPDGQQTVAAPEDPLGYRVTASSGRGERGEYNPSPFAALHKDGGTGGLLTISYTNVQELPDDIGFTVMSQKWVATAEPLLALKKMKQEENDKKRQLIAQSNRQSFGGHISA